LLPLRARCWKLSGVYVKLGQLRHTPDLVDPLVSKELEVLLDKCPAEPLQDTTQTILEDLGLSTDAELPFVLLGEISSASFGCVYRVKLESGRVAAMKILRRRIEVQTKNDLRFLQGLARVLDLLAITHRYRMEEWIEELRRWTSEELDYRLEARKMTYIAKRLRRVGGVKIPRVIWPLTTRRLLTMEYLEGRWLSGGHASLNKAALSHARLFLRPSSIRYSSWVLTPISTREIVPPARRQSWNDRFWDNRGPADAPAAFGPCCRFSKRRDR
jgi:ubiquinone biosynthesis protein